MNGDDLIRKRLDSLLQGFREQHDQTLAGLTAGLIDLVTSSTADLRREVEDELNAQTQTRVEAVQSAATSRIAQAEADAAATIAAIRAEAAVELQRAREEADARTAAVDAQVAQVERDRDAKVAAATARLAEIERERDAHAARVAEIERERDRQNATLQAAQGSSPARSEAVVLEREADLALLDRLLGGLRAIDTARTLTEVLDAVAVHAARETARVAVLLIRGDRFHGWRAAGFDATLREGAAIDVDMREGGIVTRAARTGRRAATSDREAMPAAVATLSPPSFAALPPDRVGLAVPVAVGGHVVAVVYADDVGDPSPRVPSAWPEAIEILVRHAARALESLTAAKAVAAARAIPPAAETTGAASESPDEAAKRYARLLVLEIKLYHQPAVEAGRRAKDLAERLALQIARARALYEERIGPDVRSRMDYFDQELVRTLADGNPELLGAVRSGSTSS